MNANSDAVQATNLVITTNVVWEEFSSNLKGFIHKRVQDEQDADDILQDVFLKIHNKIDSLKDENKLAAWVYQITRNAITDYYRRQSRVSETNMELPEEIEDLVESPMETGETDNHITACLKPLIDSLPEKYQQAIVLTEYETLTQKEMAERLGISLPGAKARVRRARKKIKTVLLEGCHFEFDRLGNVIDYQAKEGGCDYCAGNIS